MSDRHPASNIFAIIVVLLFFYIGIAELRYRWMHPEKTETQLFLETFDILLWR